LTKANLEALNLALVRDEFDVDTFNPNPSNAQNVDENDESSSRESDEETTEGLVDIGGEALVDTGGEGNESTMTQSIVHVCDVPTSIHIDLMLYYTEELRALKSKHINLLEYLSHKDISQIGLVVCDSADMTEEGNPRVTEEVLKKSRLFESLDVMKFFFQDYAVLHHRSFYVTKSNKDVHYIIRCQIESCSWVSRYIVQKVRFTSERCQRLNNLIVVVHQMFGTFTLNAQQSTHTFHLSCGETTVTL
jgi:hypothetical protein